MDHASTANRGRWTVFGLVFALFAIPVIVTVARQFDTSRPDVIALREVSIFAAAAVLLFIVTRKEHLPLSSLGLRFDRVSRSLWQGIALAVVLLAVALAAIAGVTALGMKYGEGTKVAPSLALVTLTVIRAGFAEELFFRGYVLERLQAMTGSTWLGAIVSLMVFAGFHYSAGLAGVLVAFAVGGALTLYYVWKRDLLAAIIAHFLVDFVPNVLLPLLGADG